jgi:HSP20 family protein
MRILRSSSAFDLFDRLEQQLSQQLHSAERIPAAEVHETAEAYELVLELPGVDRDAIAVQATERTLVISAERRHPHGAAGQPAGVDDVQGQAPGEALPAAPAPAAGSRGVLLSEFRYGSWGRRFRFPQPIEREQLQAVYRDGLLTVTAPKAQTLSTVTVKVEG